MLTQNTLTRPASMRSAIAPIRPCRSYSPSSPPLVGKRDHRRAPVAVDDDAHVAAEAMRVPGMTFAAHG